MFLKGTVQFECNALQDNSITGKDYDLTLFIKIDYRKKGKSDLKKTEQKGSEIYCINEKAKKTNPNTHTRMDTHG